MSGCEREERMESVEESSHHNWTSCFSSLRIEFEQESMRGSNLLKGIRIELVTDTGERNQSLPTERIMSSECEG